MASPPHPPSLSTADKKDLDKFTKYLAMKAVQVVVQSRLGDRCQAPSCPDTTKGTSWYNLSIRDIPEVMSETKRAMTGQIPAPGRPLVVEISLKTAEGDSLVLEWWRLAVVAGGDPQIKVTHTVYNRMGLLLKSLITVSRVTPAYRLSRRQGADSYVICYRVFLGDPPEQPFLGEGALTAKVGQVTTPTSTIVCCVDYRTNMTITPCPTSQPIMVKSDHFNANEDFTPRLQRREHRTSESSELGITSDDSQEMRLFATSPPERLHKRAGEEEPIERMKYGAFARTESLRSLPCLEEELQEPLLNLLPRPRPESTVSVTSGETSGTDSHTDTQFLMSSDSGKLAAGGGESGKVVVAAVSDVPPKMSLGAAGGLERGRKGSFGRGMGARKNLSDLLSTDDKTTVSRRSSGVSSFGGTDLDKDYVMIDIKTPFAQPSSYVAEGATGCVTGPDPSLGSFFKEVSHAPSLPSLPSAEPLADCLQSWTQQLSTFESSLQDYDELLNQIGSSSEQEDDQL